MPTAYVHGYSAREGERLHDQAQTLAGLLHQDTRYPAGALVLECGCGAGAQTALLAAASPLARIVAVDLSAASLQAARRRTGQAGVTNAAFLQADAFQLPFAAASFDHIFLCFVLEHLANPAHALATLRRLLKPGGTLTVIEGDHGSWYCHPESEAARRAVSCLVELQARAGGDSLIGRRLYPLLREAGFETPSVSPRMVYVDASRPEWVEGFSRNTFIAMVEGVRERALAASLVTEQEWDAGIEALHRATGPGGTFCYTFFKAVATR